MAALGEVPFGLYYGSVDSTPLFVLLAGASYRRSGDWDFLEWMWPHVEAALGWIDEHGDLDGDGFVEYWRRNGGGLVNQGWKDSNDSVFHGGAGDREVRPGTRIAEPGMPPARDLLALPERGDQGLAHGLRLSDPCATLRALRAAPAVRPHSGAFV